jgi:spore coat polysaccharide biosynthesis protein SpsF
MPHERVVAIVQARFSSRRLPGKVLAPIAGRPMLGVLIERLSRCAGLDGICIATSNDASDDAVAAFCSSVGIDCHRGSLDDVAKRLLDAAEASEADAFVRVNGDSPLIDPQLVSRGVIACRAHSPDLVSNVLVRSFPKGQSVEVIKTSTLRNALPDFEQGGDHEHVTPYFYRNARRFSIEPFQYERDASQMQLSVDTPDDLERIRRLVAQFSRPHWSYGVDELLGLIEERAT